MSSEQIQKIDDKEAALLDQKNQVETLLEQAEIKTEGSPKLIKSRSKGYEFTLRLQKNLARNELCQLCDTISRSENKLFAGSLLLGVFDCKGYPDKEKKYLVIDCPGENEKIIKRCLSKFNITKAKLNPERKRKNNQSGSKSYSKSRKPQLRIKREEAFVYLHQIGFTWKFKYFNAEKSISGLPAQSLSKNPSQQGLIAQYILDKYGINHSSTLIDEDQPLLDILTQDLGDIDNETRDRASKVDKPQPIPTNYERLSSDKRQKRDAETVRESLVRCGWKCEIGVTHNSEHKTFTRAKDHTPYLEPHHLIPLKSRNHFKYNIDCPANVVMLCSKCHDEIHYGANRDKLIIELFELRKTRLQEAGLLTMEDGGALSVEKLIAMYK